MGECQYAVPSYWDIGKVYKHLIKQVALEKKIDVVDAIIVRDLGIPQIPPTGFLSCQRTELFRFRSSSALQPRKSGVLFFLSLS